MNYVVRSCQFFWGTQTVTDEGHYFSGSTKCQGCFSTVCDSILVVRLGLWVRLSVVLESGYVCG